MEMTTPDLGPRIGTEIPADAAVLLSGTHAGQIRALLEQRGVLIMRGRAPSVDGVQNRYRDHPKPGLGC